MPNVLAPIYEAPTDEGDDGLYLPGQLPKKDTRSKLVKSREALGGQRQVPCCPFGCHDAEDMDSEGYCTHVVGFTGPKGRETYQPLKFRADKDGKVNYRYRFTDGTDPQPVKPGDRLVEISGDYCRVYRPKPAETTKNPTA